MLWILLVLIPMITAEGGFTKAIGNYEQRSFEFATEKSFHFDATIRDFVVSAIKHDVALEMSQNCTKPVPIALQKCKKTFLYSNSKTTLKNLLFQEEWLDYLLKITHLKCHDNARDDQSMTIQVIATEKTYCKFLFRYAEKTNNFTPVKNATHSINFNQAPNQSIVYKTAIDIDTLIKNRKLDLATSIKENFNVFLGKCDFVAPHHFQTREKFEDAEIEQIIKMAKLFCHEDRSRSFDTYVSSEVALRGNLFYDVFGARTNSSSSVCDRFIVLFAVFICAGAAIGISTSYGFCLNSDGLADDDCYWEANLENNCNGKHRVMPADTEFAGKIKNAECQNLNQEAWC